MFRRGFALVIVAVLFPERARGQDIDLVRVPTQSIMIPLPGVAVIRDSAHWARLWQRFEAYAHRSDGSLVRSVPPPIDFQRYMLVAAALGSLSGCSNQAHWVRRIRQNPDSIVVTVGPPFEGPEVTCMMIIEPLDVVRISRSAKPIYFRPALVATPVPDTASWWIAPDWPAWDAMDPSRRGVFLTAWARDLTTPLADLEEITRRRGRDWTIAHVLLERPEVLQSPVALLNLVDAADEYGRQARHLLLAKFGLRLAGDPNTPPAALLVLIEELTHDAAFPETAKQLMANERVRQDQQLLKALTRWSQRYPGVYREACRLYLARWPAWERILDANGQPTRLLASSVPCPDLPAPSDSGVPR